MIKRVNRRCPNCGCEMYVNADIIFVSDPPLYEATCCCGHYEYVHATDFVESIDMLDKLNKLLQED